MIQTKQSDSTSLETTQLGFEEATLKGKLYNPLSGRELYELLLKRLVIFLTPAIGPESAQAVSDLAKSPWSRHPSLDTDVIAYPKADIELRAHVAPAEALNDVPLIDVTIHCRVYQHPREENRMFEIELLCRVPNPYAGDPIVLTDTFNLDDIPPDALRILNDLPVPTPQRKPGSGPNGEALVIDEPKPASEQQKEAVQKQFGSKEKGTKK